MAGRYNIITSHNAVDKESWNRFVASHPAGNIFHTPDYVTLIENTPLHKVLFIGVTEGNDIRGLCVSAVIGIMPPPLTKFTARAVVWGGPLVDGDNPEVASLLLQTLNRLTGRQALFTQFRNLTDMSALDTVFRNNGYSYEPHLNVLISLKKDAGRLHSELHPTRRKQIGRSVRRGVTVTMADLAESEIMDRCYSLLQSVYRREGLPYPSRQFFDMAAGLFAPQHRLRLYVASFEGDIIGFRMALYYNGVVYDWYAASSPDHNDKYPNDILPWEIIRQGAEEGFHLFDFGGAGRPDKPYGVRDYKMKFGGELVSYGRYNRIHMPLIYHPLMLLFNIRRKLLRRS
ncbi:MAG: GNAT family N-acetyltransferase [Bacteroidales bacterium]|nr:GNAT family N-acetyltransferase [Bacteroidales bacterium]